MLPDLEPKALVEFLELMLLTRRFEEQLIELSQERNIGHFHVYIGQESTGIPALSLLEQGDLSFTNHRNHGHLIARGAEPGPMYAEILGRVTGYCRGKGGTLHLASAEHGFPTTSSATGGCIPPAVGAGFGFQRLGSDRVSVCLIGDGALEEGAWHESANIAAMELLPVIFLCENNSLEALGQRAGEYPSSTMAASDLTELASVFGIESVAVNGLDTRAVYQTMAEAVHRARTGGGPPATLSAADFSRAKQPLNLTCRPAKESEKAWHSRWIAPIRNRKRHSNMSSLRTEAERCAGCSMPRLSSRPYDDQ